MDKIQKSLNKLNNKEKASLKKILLKINNQDFYGLDFKQLKGYKNIFRIRKNSLRIIFTVNNNETTILAVERRSEKTYKFKF